MTIFPLYLFKFCLKRPTSRMSNIFLNHLSTSKCFSHFLQCLCHIFCYNATNSEHSEDSMAVCLHAPSLHPPPKIVATFEMFVMFPFAHLHSSRVPLLPDIAMENKFVNLQLPLHLQFASFSSAPVSTASLSLPCGKARKKEHRELLSHSICSPVCQLFASATDTDVSDYYTFRFIVTYAFG